MGNEIKKMASAQMLFDITTNRTAEGEEEEKKLL